MPGCLSYLWGMINTSQLIVNLPLLNIYYSDLVNTIFGIFINIASFNFVPTTNYMITALDIDNSDDSYNYSFNNMGYGSTNFFINAGNMALQVCMYPFILCGVYVLGVLKESYPH